MLSFSVLASGSSGNAIYIRSQTTQILLDAGVSAKQIRQRLEAAADVGIDGLDAILVTHEHVDHVRGLPVVAKQTSAPIYTTEGTWNGMGAAVREVMEASRQVCVTSQQAFTVGDIVVTPFSVSHDAEDPVAYRFDCADESLTVLTDLGYVSDTIKSVIQGCQAYVWEANHDVGMLRAGPYPWNLKRRILGDKGHLSNEDAGVAIADILGTESVQVYLAHLSEENNQPDLAELTVSSVLRDCKSDADEQVRLHRTSRHTATPLTPVKLSSIVR